MKKNTGRRNGQIRITTQPTTTLLPYSIRELTINNINIYNEMKHINTSSDDIFEKYDQIIRDL